MLIIMIMMIMIIMIMIIMIMIMIIMIIIIIILNHCKYTELKPTTQTVIDQSQCQKITSSYKSDVLIGARVPSLRKSFVIGCGRAIALRRLADWLVRSGGR